MGCEKKSAEHELKKHAAAIHCSNTLSLLQRKISNALLYHAYKELMLKEEHEISVKQLCKLIGYHGNNHAVIKDGLKGLLSTVIEWNVVSDTTGAEDWTASSILASVSLRGPICLYAYSPRMKQLLHSPSMFGKINLFIQSRFKSSYGLALYENCIRYRGLPFTKWFDMATFRKLMGVPATKYPIFRDFKKRVLDKSIEEVNAYSDLIVECEVFKDGRQVVKLRFSLKERAKKVRLGASKATTDETDDISTNIKVKLTEEFGLSTEQIETVLTEYEIDYLIDKIAIIEASKNYQEGKVQNVAGYLLSALKNNYIAGKASTQSLVKKQIQEKQEERDNIETKRQIEHAREAYLTYREKEIDHQVMQLSGEDKAILLKNFYQSAEDSIHIILQLQRNKYTRETILNSPQIKALLRQFVLQQLPHIQLELMSFEEFTDSLITRQIET